MEKFEYHIKEVIKLMKKLFTYCLYLVIFFITLFVLFIILKFHENRLGIIIFTLLLIIVFSIECIYGFKKYNIFKWILNNYQTNKEKCLELLLIKNVNLNITQEVKNDKNLPYSVSLSFHIKKAYDILDKESKY